jgi:hypothetical protein
MIFEQMWTIGFGNAYAIIDYPDPYPAGGPACTDQDPSSPGMAQRVGDQIAERALELVEESFIASAGPGGQNVNKVANAVIVALNLTY